MIVFQVLHEIGIYVTGFHFLVKLSYSGQVVICYILACVVIFFSAFIGLTAVFYKTFALKTNVIMKGILTVTIAFWDIFSTVLFLPVFSVLYFSTMCKEENSGWKMFINYGEECYSSAHITIAGVCIVGAFLFLLCSALFQTLVVPYVYIKGSPLSRVHNDTEIGMFLNKILNVFLFPFFYEAKTNSTSLFLFIVSISSGILWRWHKTHDLRYDLRAQAILDTLCFVNFEANFFLLAREVTQKIIQYDISTITVILSLAYVNFKMSYRLDCVLQHSEIIQFEDYKKMKEFMKLIQMTERGTKENKKNDFLTIGYLYVHNTKCTAPACPVNYIFDENSTDMSKHRENIYRVLRQIIKRIFEWEITKMKKCKDRAILFLCEILIRMMNSFSMASGFVQTLSYSSCGLQQQIVLYSFHKEIRDMINLTHSGGEDRLSGETDDLSSQLHILKMIRQEKLTAEFRKSIEYESMLISELWGVLEEITPSYQTFQRLAFTILKEQKNIETRWTNLEDNGFIPLALIRLYSNYCHFVAQDENYATELLDKLEEYSLVSSELKSISNTNFQYINSGVMSVSALIETFGKIENCNGALQLLVGYSKKELVGMNIDSLLPTIFLSAHARAMREACVRIESGESLLIQDKFYSIMHVSKYIFPVKVRMCSYPNYSNKYQFFAMISLDKEKLTIDRAFILLDSSLNIAALSSNCLVHFGFTNSVINLPITKFIPDLKYFKKISERHNRECSIKCETSFDDNDKFHLAEFCSEGKLNFNISQYKDVTCFFTKHEYKNTVLGYSMVLQVLPQRVDRNTLDLYLKNNDESLKSPCSDEACVSTFDYNWELNCFTLQSVSHTKEEDLTALGYCSKLFNNHSPQINSCFLPAEESVEVKNSEQRQMDVPENERIEEKPTGFYSLLRSRLYNLNPSHSFFVLFKEQICKPDFEKEVTLYRLDAEGNIQFLDNANVPLMATREFEDIEAQGERHQRAEFQASNANIIKSTIKNKKILHEFLYEIPMNGSFIQLYILTALSLLLSSTILLTYHFMIHNLFSEFLSQIPLMNLKFVEYRTLGDISDYVMQAIAVNEGNLSLNYVYPEASTLSDFMVNTHSKIQSLSQEISNAMIEEETYKFTAVLDHLHRDTVIFQYNDTGSSHSISLAQAYSIEIQYIEKLIGFSSISNFTRSDMQFATLDWNFKNPILSVRMGSINSFVTELQQHYLSKRNSLRLIIWLLIGICMVSQILFIPFATVVNYTIRKQANMFLKLPFNEINKMKRHVLQFVKQVKNCEYNKEVESSVDSEDESEFPVEEEHTNTKLLLLDGEKKTFDTSFASTIIFLWRILLLMLFSFFYIWGMIQIGENHFFKLLNLSDIISSTVGIETQSLMAEHFERSYFYNKTGMSLYKSPFETMMVYQANVVENIQKIMNSFDDMTELFSSNEKTDMETFFFRNMCQTGLKSIDCYTPVAIEGYLAVMSKFLHYLKNVVIIYDSLEIPPRAMNTSEFKEIVLMLNKLIRPGFAYYYETMMKIATNSNNRIIMLILYLTILFILCFTAIIALIWLPFVYDKRRELIQTRRLIGILPLDLLARMKNFQDFFTKLIFQNKSQSC